VILNIETPEFNEKSMLKIIQYSDENSHVVIENYNGLFQNIANNDNMKADVNTNN